MSATIIETLSAVKLVVTLIEALLVCTDEVQKALVWEKIGKVAAENAAKPEIQGVSPHD